MQRIYKYAIGLCGLLVMLLQISGCERQPALDHAADTAFGESLFQGNVVKLDTLVFTNPVQVNGNVRFDIISTLPQIKVGDLVYYPGGNGVLGKVVSAVLIGSRMVFQLDKSGLDQVFRSISIQDTVSKRLLKSRTRTSIHAWNSDTLGLDGLYWYNDLWQSGSLQVQSTKGRFYAKSAVGQFIF
jgi:hypothetical protein